MEKPQRRYGFPLLMLLGFTVGAIVATVATIVQGPASQRGNFSLRLGLGCVANHSFALRCAVSREALS